MPQITLDLSDAAELAQTLTLLAGCLSGSQKPVLGKSPAAYAGHPPTPPRSRAPTCTGSPSCCSSSRLTVRVPPES
jgi:hypothetical protein